MIHILISQIVIFLGAPPPALPFKICGCHYVCPFSIPCARCIGDLTIQFFDLLNGAASKSAYINYLFPLNPAQDGGAIPTGIPIQFEPSHPRFPATSAYFVYTLVGDTHSFEVFSGPLPNPQFYARITYVPQWGNLEIYLNETFYP